MKKISFLLLYLFLIIPINDIQAEPPAEMNKIEMLEFKQCSCDSATYCLDDQDIMYLNSWFERVKHHLSKGEQNGTTERRKEQEGNKKNDNRTDGRKRATGERE